MQTPSRQLNSISVIAAIIRNCSGKFNIWPCAFVGGEIRRAVGNMDGSYSVLAMVYRNDGGTMEGGGQGA